MSEGCPGCRVGADEGQGQVWKVVRWLVTAFSLTVPGPSPSTATHPSLSHGVQGCLWLPTSVWSEHVWGPVRAHPCPCSIGRRPPGSHQGLLRAGPVLRVPLPPLSSPRNPSTT